MFEKQIANQKKKFAEMENSVSDETAKEVYNAAIYDAAPLAFGVRTFSQLDERERNAFKRIIAASRDLSINGVLT